MAGHLRPPGWYEGAATLRARLETLTGELAAERLGRAEERLELRERLARISALEEVATAAQALAEAATRRAENQAEALAAELRELRRPLWERVVRAIRGEE